MGWIARSDNYDDGGLSGGTMDRPALQRLLADIEKRRVDLVVVYKVDRLTRSLADFAKIVEVFDTQGVSFVSVTHANKKGRRYRYYISKRLMHKTDSTGRGWRLPAKELESAVADSVRDFLTDELRVIDALQLTNIAPDHLSTILRRAAKAADDLRNVQSELQRRLLRSLLHRVTMREGSLHIAIKKMELHRLVSGENVVVAVEQETLIDLTVPIALKRRGVEAKLMVRATQDKTATPDENLIALVAQGHHWFDQLAKENAGSIKEIAEREGTDPSDVGHNMQLAFLAPDIVEAILAGRQPIELTANRLRRVGTLPLEWDRQRQLLGFPT